MSSITVRRYLNEVQPSRCRDHYMYLLKQMVQAPEGAILILSITH
ncbi:hypothetical protein ACEQPO_02185 [Bacillus sp. SL00103]